jgi:hypothetical protein
VRYSIGAALIVDNMRENKLRWFGRVMRRVETKTVRMVIKINFKGKRGRGRPKRRWLNMIENVMRVVGVYVGDIENSDESRFRIRLANSK